MQEKKLFRTLVTITVVIAVFLLVVAGFRYYHDVFDGSKVKLSDLYTLEFTRMNQADSAVLTLEDGDELHCVWQIEKGRLDVRVTSADGSTIYVGNKVRAADFLLAPDKGGEYTVSVTARNAAGSMSFSVRSPK